MVLASSRFFGSCLGDLPDLGARAGPAQPPALTPKSGDLPRQIPENPHLLAGVDGFPPVESQAKVYR
jgi:hypothetical protein